MYRVKQFLWALTAYLTKQDKLFLEEYITEEERKLFYRMPVYEQKHCIKVARDVEELSRERGVYSKKLVVVALFHDIGKTYKPLNPINKSIMVLADKLTRGKIRKYTNIKKIRVYYEHGKLGEEILGSHGYDERFLYLVKEHHNNDLIEKDEELEILRICDNKN